MKKLLIAILFLYSCSMRNIHSVHSQYALEHPYKHNLCHCGPTF